VRPHLHRSLALVSLIGVCAAGCGHDEELALGSLAPPVALGGVCGVSTAHCLGETSILRCEGRLWTEESCSSVCGEIGRLTIGCFDRAYGDDCLCAVPEADSTADASPCAASRQCSGPDAIEYCDRHGTRRKSCTEVCAGLAPPQRSTGCREGTLGALDDCACTIEDTPCGDTTAVCDGPSLLARCIAGLWTLSNCREQCAAEQAASCSSWAGDAGAACRCGSPP
jgi:hypothetical protein